VRTKRGSLWDQARRPAPRRGNGALGDDGARAAAEGWLHGEPVLMGELIAPNALCDVPADWVADFSQCLYQWQGLEAGIIALFAAIIGAMYLHKQIHQAELHREDELSRQRLAAIVALPLTLGRTSELLQGIADEIALRFARLRDVTQPNSDIIVINPGVTFFDPVEFPEGTVRSFQDFVETLSASSDVAHVAQLIAAIQILLARIRSFDPNAVDVERSLLTLMLDCAWAAHLNDSLYNHARSVGREPFSVTEQDSSNEWEKVRAKSHSLLFNRTNADLMMNALSELVDSNVRGGASPWISARL